MTARDDFPALALLHFEGTRAWDEIDRLRAELARLRAIIAAIRAVLEDDT